MVGTVSSTSTGLYTRLKHASPSAGVPVSHTARGGQGRRAAGRARKEKSVVDATCAPASSEPKEPAISGETTVKRRVSCL